MTSPAPQKRIRAWQWIFLLLLIVGTVYALRQSSSTAFHDNEGTVFGTVYHIKYDYTRDLQADIEAELRRVDSSLSMFNETSIISRVNRNEPVSETFQPTGSLQAMTVEGRIGSVRWTVERADSTLFYGATMDGDAGIAVDNFSLRGTSGLSLRSIPMHTLREFGRERPYDLIVLQYGLNVATELGRNYDKYIAGMHTALEHLKEAFPQAGILIVGVGDRDYKTEEGELRTMPGVKNLMRYQQNLAADAGVAFWNLFEAMGGDCSMVRLVEAKPAMANYDYTHINFRGGKHLAQLLYEALVYGKEQYDRRRTYEEMEP